MQGDSSNREGKEDGERNIVALNERLGLSAGTVLVLLGLSRIVNLAVFLSCFGNLHLSNADSAWQSDSNVCLYMCLSCTDAVQIFDSSLSGVNTPHFFSCRPAIITRLLQCMLDSS